VIVLRLDGPAASHRAVRAARLVLVVVLGGAAVVASIAAGVVVEVLVRAVATRRVATAHVHGNVGVDGVLLSVARGVGRLLRLRRLVVHLRLTRTAAPL